MTEKNKKNAKRVVVKLDEFRRDDKGKLDLSRNVREQTLERYDPQPLAEDIALRGLQDPPLVHRAADGKLDIIKGFRRTTAVEMLGWKELNVDLVEGLDEHEIIGLMLDHGQRMGLNPVELQNAIERAVGAGYTEKDTVTILKGLFQEHYPIPEAKAKTMKTPEDFLNYYRGVVQNAKRVYESPLEVRDLYIKKLRGEQRWPTNAEITMLHKAFRAEADTNPTITRDKPGPKFRKELREYLKLKKEAPTGTRPKSAAAKNQDQIKTEIKQTDCVLFKIVLLHALNKIDSKAWIEVQKVQKKLEKSLTDNDLKTLAKLAGFEEEEEEAEEAEEK